MLKNLSTGILYRNPTPHLKSIHAYFPSVAVSGNGDLVASIVLGEAFEALNLRSHISRSTDNGETWTLENPLVEKQEGMLTSDFARLTTQPDGGLTALVMLCDRSSHPDMGLANPVTLGFTPSKFMTSVSNDNGASWEQPQPVQSPFGETPLELCSPITYLRDGRCMIPTSTWELWEGDSHFGHRMAVLISSDNGATWPEHTDVMIDPAGQCFFWESKIIELTDSRLCALAWVHDHTRGKDQPNQFSLSSDGGYIWSPIQSTGLMGQTLTPFLLDDGRILSLYRRMDEPGLWANISKIEGSQWFNIDATPLWGHKSLGLTGAGANAVDNFNVLKFGAPCIVKLSDGMIFVAFWCYEDCVSVIRWFRFSL